MMEPFLLRAVAGGVGVALVAGPLGCFVVWRRLAYFGDTLAHSALLGVALGLLLGAEPLWGVLGVTALAALMLAAAGRGTGLAGDTLLGILAHGSLALGLVALGLMPRVRVDLLGYLFGDVLALSDRDVAVIWAGGAAALLWLARLWRPLLALTASEDLARAEGVSALRCGVGFTLLIALLVAVAMKVVGVLLVTSLLIMPAAAARPLARTPEAMATGAAAFGSLAVIGGLGLSLALDSPSGPSMVVVAVLLLLGTHAASALGRVHN